MINLFCCDLTIAQPDAHAAGPAILSHQLSTRRSASCRANDTESPPLEYRHLPAQPNKNTILSLFVLLFNVIIIIVIATRSHI